MLIFWNSKWLPRRKFNWEFLILLFFWNLLYDVSQTAANLRIQDKIFNSWLIAWKKKNNNDLSVSTPDVFLNLTKKFGKPWQLKLPVRWFLFTCGSTSSGSNSYRQLQFTQSPALESLMSKLTTVHVHQYKLLALVSTTSWWLSFWPISFCYICFFRNGFSFACKFFVKEMFNIKSIIHKMLIYMLVLLSSTNKIYT